MLQIISIGLLCLIGANMALVCYETDPETGKVKEVNNPEYTYCALVPRHNRSESVAFGVGPQEDSVWIYDATFQRASSDDYSVLKLCIYEKHDFLIKMEVQSELLFRCVCNQDLCNSPTQFHHVFDTNQLVLH